MTHEELRDAAHEILNGTGKVDGYDGVLLQAERGVRLATSVLALLEGEPRLVPIIPDSAGEVERDMARENVRHEAWAMAAVEEREGEVVRCICEWAHPVTGEIETMWPAELAPDCLVHGGVDLQPGIEEYLRTRAPAPTVREGETERTALEGAVDELQNYLRAGDRCESCSCVLPNHDALCPFDVVARAALRTGAERGDETGERFVVNVLRDLLNEAGGEYSEQILTTYARVILAHFVRTGAERGDEKPSGYDWKIERDPEDGLTYITHAKWSLVGQGENLTEAASDLAADAPATFAAYTGRVDLSAGSVRMVEWLRDTFGLSAVPLPTPSEKA